MFAECHAGWGLIGSLLRDVYRANLVYDLGIFPVREVPFSSLSQSSLLRKSRGDEKSLILG